MYHITLCALPEHNNSLCVYKQRPRYGLLPMHIIVNNVALPINELPACITNMFSFYACVNIDTSGLFGRSSKFPPSIWETLL